MAAVTVYSDFGAQEYKVSPFPLFPSVCHKVMGPDAMIFIFWILSFKLFFYSPFSPSSRGALIPLPFCHKSGVICISEAIGIFPGRLAFSLRVIHSGFLMMLSACNSNKQGNNILTWCSLPVLNQSAVSCLVLTVASWSTYRFLRRQKRWSGIPISLRIFPVCCDPQSQRP